MTTGRPSAPPPAPSQIDPRLQRLVRAAEELHAASDARQILRTLVEHAAALVGAGAGLWATHQHDRLVFTECLRDGAWHDLPPLVVHEHGRGVPAWLLQHRRRYICNQPASDPVASPDLVARLGVRNLVAVPLVARDGELLGAFELRDKPGGGAYDDEDGALLDGLAAIGAAALENATQRGRATLLAEAGRLLVDSDDVESALRRIAALIVPALADWCTVVLIDGADVRRVAAVHRDPARAPDVARYLRAYAPTRHNNDNILRALETGRGVFLPTVSDAELVAGAQDEGHLALLRTLGCTSCTIVPMLARRTTIGVLCLMMSDERRAFSASDYELARELATRAGLAVENARRLQSERQARQAAEEARRAAEEARAEVDAQRRRLVGVLAQTPAMINFLRGPELVVEFAHPRTVERLGGRRIEGRPLREAVPELDAQGIGALLARVYATGQPYVATEARVPIARGDGGVDESFWDSVYLPLRDASGAVDGVMTFDLEVTDRVHKRRALEDAQALARTIEAQFRALFDAMPQLGWTAQPDGYIDFYNRGWYEYTGTTFEEMQGWGWTKVHDPAILPTVVSRWRDCLARGEPFELEFPLRRHDGQLRWFLTRANPMRDERGEIVRWVGINTDIHDRTQAGRVSEERLQLLIESIKDYAVFMLDTGGHVLTWNPGAERIKQYRADEIIGRHFSTFYSDEEKRSGKCEYELEVAAEVGRFEDEGWRVKKDGSRFWANVVISAVRDDAGRLVGFSKVTRDLSERKRTEEERAARVAAEQANRAKDEFLAMLGHELRNPLAPIVTALQLMKLRGDLSSTREHEIIQRQVQHLLRLVDDLLDISRITRGKVELKHARVELAEVVASAVEMAEPLIDSRQHRLAVDVERGLVVVGDAARLAQVVSNLLTNAAKYTDRGGDIRVGARRDGAEAVLRVRDNGAGIAPELLPRVFELFVQGARSHAREEGGLGLGLALVRNLVQLHGGTVEARSDGPGRGSEFVVRLPLAARAEAHASAVPTVTTQATAAPRRVLIVDDNADAAELLGETLRLHGHEVRVCHDPAVALRLVVEFVPDVAILDIGLPVMDGLELGTQLRARVGGGLRLVALSGYGQPEDRARSARAGFERHLVKPVIVDELAAIIASR